MKKNKIITNNKVAVIMGGQSAERVISLRTGEAIYKALIANQVNAITIDTKQPFIQRLIDEKIDQVFIALHGRGGEDGTIQGLLEQLKLPYTGSGVLASSLAMDKHRTKQIWQANQLPTPNSILVTTNTPLEPVIKQLGLPLMVKPVLEGSSVGISKVNNIEQLGSAIKTATQFNCEIMVEQYITGTEYTAAILDNTVLPLIRLETPRDFYDFAAKYEHDDTTYICPCGLNSAIEADLKTLALNAFLSIGASGWGRVDFLCDASGQAWLIEVNTVPGMTDHSLVPMAAKAAGIEFDELVLRILSTAKCQT